MNGRTTIGAVLAVAMMLVCSAPARAYEEITVSDGGIISGKVTITGGKPVVSIPPFVVIAFELTILLTGLSTLIAVLILGRLPQTKPSPTYDPRFSVDRFGVAVACPPDKAETVGAMLSSAGAEEVRR